MASADLLISGGDVVTMNPRREVLQGGCVAVAGDRIAGVGATSRLRALHPGVPELDARDCVVIPGMVNAHQHLTGDPLARSCIPDDLPPGASIFQWSVPLHGAHSARDDEVSATLAAVESVRLGVTTVVEAGTVAHPVEVGEAMARVGLRGTVGTWGWDIEEGPFAAPAGEVIGRQRAVLDRFPSGGLVEGWVTLVGHGLASDRLLTEAADLARAAGTGLTMHMSPTSSDPEVYLERTGQRPLLHLERLGVLGPHLLLAHGVWLDSAEVDALLRTDTAVAYCPWAYLRLGQGVSHAGRHAEIVRRGGRVALGCDASNAGDQLDVLRAAALAAGLAKDAALDATAMTAHQAFELATIAGARALRMDGRIGSLEAGKQADIVVLDATGPQWTPRGDVGLQLVWSADGHCVRDVFIAGRQVVRGGRCVTVDEAGLRAEATGLAEALRRRAGIEVPHPWPLLPSA
ncbi:MAG TPA: amidohydrolase family protein [Candidatus Dormibacteraeota bacterium]